MGSLAIQPSLAGGELAPALWGRVDVARYGISLKTCRNFVVYPYGGVKNRSGSRYLGTVKDQSKRVRLIPFAYNTTQTYVLEFGAGYARIWSNGGQVVYPTGSAYGVAGQPVEIATPYATADLPLLKFTQSADVLTIAHPAHPTQQFKRFANDHWTMSAFPYVNGPFQTINIDLSVSMSVDKVRVGDTATVTCSMPVFTSDHVGLLLYLEQKDFGIPWEVSKPINVGDIRRSDGKYYQALTAGTTGTLRPTQTVDTWSDGGVSWMFLHPGFGIGIIQATAGTPSSPSPTCTLLIQNRLPDSLVITPATGNPVASVSAPFGGNIALTLSAPMAGPTLINNGDMANWALTYVPTGGGSKTVTGTAQASGIDPSTNLVITLPIAAAIADLVTFTSGTVSNVSNGVTNSPTYKWAFGAWGASLGYPSCVAYHQQRLCFGSNANQPQTIWMSRSASFTDFGVSNPVQDDDAVTFTLASAKVDQVKSLLPLNRLMLLTAGGEWVVGNSNQDVITPSNISCLLQGYRGASDLPPIGVGNTALFVQRQGQVVRDLSYQFANDSFTGDDLTIYANHLVEGHSIQEWVYQQIPITCVWAIREDGVLLGLTYLKEQQVVAWHRHDTQGGLYESLCVVSEGSEDVLYVVVNRGGGRFVERFESRVVTDVKKGFFVDAGLSYDGTNTGSTSITVTGGTTWDQADNLTITASSPLFAFPATTDVGDALAFEDPSSGIVYRLIINGTSSATVATATPDKLLPAAYRSAARTDWLMARNTFSGLNHLEGQVVNILADGNVCFPQTVVNGTVNLAYPAWQVTVGLPITADLQTLDINVPGIETILPKAKAIQCVRMLVSESRSILAGRTFDNLVEVKTRQNEIYDQPADLVSDIVSVRIPTNWDTKGDFVLRHTTPDPISILALIPEVAVGVPAS